MKDDLAYLLGSYFGDGHVDYKRHAYQFIVTSEDHDFLVYISSICEKHFQKTGRISPVKNHYKLVICSKTVCNFILENCCSIENYEQADKLQKKGKLPAMPFDCEKSFIRGLMDADGWISKVRNGKYTKFSIAFKNTSYLSPQIHTMMSHHIQCGIIRTIKGKSSVRNGKISYTKDAFEWTISPDSYIKQINFKVQRKRKRAEEYLQMRSK